MYTQKHLRNEKTLLLAGKSAEIIIIIITRSIFTFDVFSATKKKLLNREITKIETLHNAIQHFNVEIVNVSFLSELRRASGSAERCAHYQRRRYYLCLVNSGTEVQATDVVEANKTGEIHFVNNRFVFSNLQANFQIFVYLFGMSSTIEGDSNPKNDQKKVKVRI